MGSAEAALSVMGVWHARGGHGLPKISYQPTILYPPMPGWRTTPETALLGRWPAAIFYPFGTPCRTSMALGVYGQRSRINLGGGRATPRLP
jgi:hypothetical protein